MRRTCNTNVLSASSRQPTRVMPLTRLMGSPGTKTLLFCGYILSAASNLYGRGTNNLYGLHPEPCRCTTDEPYTQCSRHTH